MKKIVILSDLWGKEKASWVSNYTDILSNYFDIVFYDSCDLATINKSDYSQDNLHKQFVNGGIEKAVEQLIKLGNNVQIVIGFSIGGLIAWKYAIEKNIEYIYSISSTRIRKEKDKPKGNISIFFGSNDSYIPTKDWFNDMNLEPILFNGKGHEFYKDEKLAKEIVSKILKESSYIE